MFPLLLLTLAAATPSGQIAFLSGAPACVVVYDLGTKSTRRVGQGRDDGPPVWSPGGDRLAFDSATPQGRSIYVVRADGTQGRFLKHESPWNVSPRWSPEGNRVAYASGTGHESVVRVYDLDSDEEITWGGNRAGLFRPVWVSGRLGAELVGARDTEAGMVVRRFFRLSGNEEALLLAVGLQATPKAMTTHVFCLTPDTATPLSGHVLDSQGTYEEWAVEPSRNGRNIAFDTNDGGDREVFIYTQRGVHDASNHRAADWNPVWSPDSKWVVFESLRSGRLGLYRVHYGTDRVLPVAVSDHADSASPSWAPDGEAIAYVSDRLGTPHIFVADLKTGESERLTAGNIREWAPAWRPAN